MDRLVTKTLAEIYLEQGHLEEAYSLFKTLSERDPENVELKNRLKELEEKMNFLPPETKFPGNINRKTRSEPAPAYPAGTERGHPVNLPTNLSRSTQSILPVPKKIQNLEKWLNNLRERRKP